METVSKVLMGAGSVLSFASGVYLNANLAFVAGSVSTLSVLCLQFAQFAFKESKKSTQDLNRLLQTLQLDPLPAVDQSVTGTFDPPVLVEPSG